MIVDWDGGRILDFDGSARLTCRVCILKVHRFEGVCLEIDHFSIDALNVEIEHGPIPVDLIVLAGLVVARKNQLLFKVAFPFGLKGHIDVNCVASIEVKLAWIERK